MFLFFILFSFLDNNNFLARTSVAKEVEKSGSVVDLAGRLKSLSKALGRGFDHDSKGKIEVMR
jgi:hypothetical protein